ncbi:MAG: hypothetical protein IAA89_01275 [Firmicutes bacterium]|uniref:Uncharacterized protein n=1 Tax=Candidatus Gallilactobacillus intestinavium TaxID=2840838 RepID=A0A9D9E6Y0_9LACO|nr:hypothetical protein [Candidatus Gallilactobacillus intestinavium]
MDIQIVKTLLDCNIEEAEKFKTILDFCNKFDKNAFNNAISLTHQYNFSICLDNVLKFLLTDLINNLTYNIYKDTHILLNKSDFSIEIDTDNILSYDNTILLSCDTENNNVLEWLENNCDNFVEF